MPKSDGDSQQIDLRTLLMNSIRKVADGSMEPDRGRAIADLSKAVLQAERLEYDFMKARENFNRPILIGVVDKRCLPAPEAVEGQEAETESPQIEEQKIAAPPSVKERKQPTAEQQSVLKKRIITLLIEEQPLKAHEIATKLALPLKPVQAILEDDRFEYDVDGYWLKAKTE